MSANNHRIRRRLIVELWHGGADPRTLRAAAEVAASLELDLHGLFLEDAALLGLSELPFVRELRLPTHEWQKIDSGRIAAELRHAAAAAQRLLGEVATALGVANAFEIRREEPAEALAAVVTGGDVIAIAPPGAPGSRLGPGAAHVSMAARACGAALLLLPAAYAPRHGPVVVALHDTAEPALTLAARAAIHTKERLLILVPAGASGLAESAEQRAVALGMPASRVAMRPVAGQQVEDILHALGRRHERLIVLTRQALAADAVAGAARLAASRAAPVLAL